VRVLLLEVPRLLRDFLERAMQAADECEIVKNLDDALTRASRLPPDAVVLGLTAAEDTTLVPAIFARWPRTKIMTVGLDHAATLWANPRLLGPMSPNEIADTLRDAVRRDHGDSSGDRDDEDSDALVP
jgi:DNA-binding response OmpR family regulator